MPLVTVCAVKKERNLFTLLQFSVRLKFPVYSKVGAGFSTGQTTRFPFL